MSHRKWNEEQIIGILKQVEAGRTVAEVCRENAVGESTSAQRRPQVEEQIWRA